VPKIQKLESGIRKLGGHDIEWSNLLENQATNFNGYIESPNVDNSSYNRKNVRTTSNVGLTICVSSAKERKAQIGWVVVVG
jgi:hypothetical protein